MESSQAHFLNTAHIKIMHALGAASNAKIPDFEGIEPGHIVSLSK
jgi:hypothetical protein